MGNRSRVDNAPVSLSREYNAQAASKRPGVSTNEGTGVWPSWLARFKDVIGLALIGTGVTVGLFTLCSIEKQVETAVKQTEAVWFSTRPVLTMKSIEPEKDILPWSNPVETPNGPIADPSLFHSINVTIQNVGQTPAVLDTVYYELIRDGQWFSRFRELSTLVTPDQLISDEVPTKLRTDAVNYLRIHFRYYWEKREVTAQPLIFQREYGFVFRDSAWTVGLFSSDAFDSLMNSVRSIGSSR